MVLAFVIHCSEEDLNSHFLSLEITDIEDNLCLEVIAESYIVNCAVRSDN